MYIIKDILGFPDLSAFELQRSPHGDGPIYALQSLQSFGVRFPVAVLREDSSEVVLSVVTIPNDPFLMTMNLKAPIFIDKATGQGSQRILAGVLSIREPCFAKLFNQGDI